MKGYRMVIQTKAEAEQGKAMFPDLVPGHEMEIVGIGVSEQGTVSGKTGVILLVQKEGEQLVHPILMTAAAYLTIAAGIKGAMERFGDKWEGA